MPTMIRNLLFAAAIAIGTVPVVGQVAQAQSFEIGGGGLSFGFGDDGVEIGDWDEDDSDYGIELEVADDDEDEDAGIELEWIWRRQLTPESKGPAALGDGVTKERRGRGL